MSPETNSGLFFGKICLRLAVGIEYQSQMSDSNRKNRLEIFVIIVVILAAVFLAKFPTLYNWVNTPSGFWFPKNTSWFDAWDTNFQVSDIRYGQKAGILAQNTYTTIPHNSALIYQFYTLLGIINRLLRLDPFILFHLASIISSVILILVCYYVAKVFFTDKFYRLSAFIIFVLGGGLGWLQFFGLSGDTTIAGFTMVNAFERGSEAISTALLLLTFVFNFRYMKTWHRKYLFYAIITSFLSITLHPPFAAMYIVIGLIFVFWEYTKTKKFTSLMFPVTHLILFGIYYFFVLSNLLINPGFAGVVGQELFNVDSMRLITGFGVISLFLGWALLFSHNQTDEFKAAKIFFSTQLVFIFLPFGFHLYFVKGLHVWGVILGLYGVQELFKNMRQQKLITISIVLLSLITRIYIFNDLLHPNPNNPFLFLRSDEGKALEFMSQLPVDSNILSLYRIGNYIPAHTDNRVYFGHKFQTPQAEEKLKMAKIFYLTDDEKKQTEFLRQNNIQYVYYGLEEASLRKFSKMEISNPFPYFPVIYKKDSIVIYQVK